MLAAMMGRPYSDREAASKTDPTRWMSNVPQPERRAARVAAMPIRREPKDTPSSVTQIAAAMAALGLYGGANTPAEHAAEARRLGGDAAYRLRLVNALLGAAQAEALVAESLPVSTDDRLAAYEQQLATAGAADSPTKRIRFLRWQTLRVAGPLREMAQHVETGPIPLAAAHAAEGLQQLLSVIADSQNVTPAHVGVDPTLLRPAAK
jgi:Family of unknown function (DUF6245)